jgi:hypothetical protein
VLLGLAGHTEVSKTVDVLQPLTITANEVGFYELYSIPKDYGFLFVDCEIIFQNLSFSISCQLFLPFLISSDRTLSTLITLLLFSNATSKLKIPFLHLSRVEMCVY